jgi:hypothetical protein
LQTGLTLEDAVERVAAAFMPRSGYANKDWRGVCIRMMPVLFFVFDK